MTQKHTLYVLKILHKQELGASFLKILNPDVTRENFKKIKFISPNKTK